VSVYLLDENVLHEIHPHGNANVLAWYATVAELELRISVMTLFEKRRGWERRKKDKPVLAMEGLAELDALEAAYAGRVVPIDGAVVAEWARLLGAKDKNQRDKALAATAIVHGFVLVTRNVDDVRGCNVRVLNPFKAEPVIEVV
jgi:predicted nucleic acid-binding protein